MDTGEAIPADHVRRIACDAGIIPAVLGSDGQVLDLGRSRRLVTGPVRRALVLRDGSVRHVDEACQVFAKGVAPYSRQSPAGREEHMLRLRIAVAVMAASASVAAAVPAAAAPTDHAPAGSRLVTPGDVGTQAPLKSLTTEVADAAVAGLPSDTVWLFANDNMENVSSKLCLAARAGSSEPQALLAGCDFNHGTIWPDQHWDVISVAGRGWQIYSPYLGKCLAARTGPAEPPVLAVGCDFNHGAIWNDQHWTVHLSPQGLLFDVQFENQSNGKCLGARGGLESPAVGVGCDFNHNAHWNDQHWLL